MDANVEVSGNPGVSVDHKFMLAMLDEAMSHIRTAWRNGERNAAASLIRGNQNDTKATAGALLSAWDTFVRHLDADEEVIEDLTIEEMAAIYIRLAYNRLRRKIYQDDKISGQIARANVPGKDGEFIPFDPADPKSRAEIMKILPDEIAIELGTRSERDRFVIALWVDSHTVGRLTYEEIVDTVRKSLPEEPISIATVQRIVERFKDDMRSRLKDL